MVYTGFSFFFMIFIIVGAEVMIASNQITRVYRMDSTSQLIPVIMGIALLGTVVLKTFREARKKKLVFQSRESHGNNKQKKLLGT